MSHEIAKNADGSDAFVFDGIEGGAWHGLGRAIPEEIANDPRKIAELVGASYTVEMHPVFFAGQNGANINVPNREALVRMDTLEPLEVLSGNRYNPVQPVEYFEGFRDSLAKNHLRISTAGVLKGGRIVMVTAKLTDAGFSVMGNDTTESYITLGGGYDGKMSSFGYLNDFRTVCWNTLSAALARNKKRGTLFKVPHSAIFDAQVLGAALGLVGPELKVRAEVFNTMAGRKLANDAALRFFAQALEIDPADISATKGDGQPKLSARILNQLNDISNAYLTGPGSQLESAKGTVYGALNAVTFFVDHPWPFNSHSGFDHDTH